MSGWLLRGSIIVWSSSKFLVGTGMALAFLPPLEGLVWIFAGNGLQRLWSKYVGKDKKKVVFSKKNRFLVKIRSRGGLWLVAFLTPLILSIPVGCLFANTLDSNPYRVLRIQALSVLFWSLVIFGSKGIAIYFKGI
jgi:hypothetical protein